MQYSNFLRAGVCAASLLLSGAAFAQGGVTPVAFGGGGHGFGGGGHGFSGGGMHANGGGARVHSAGNWHGGHGYGGWGSGYAYGYPDYGYDPDYAYDYGDGYPYDNGYAYDNGYDNGPGVYAQGQAGSYCQTPVNSCGLNQPSPVGGACQCRNGVDQEPGTVQP